MPITKDANGVIVYTKKKDAWSSDTTGVFADSDFAVSADNDPLKKIRFEADTLPTNTTVTLGGNAATASDITLTLPATTGTLALSGGGGSVGFTTIQTPAGTSPVATGADTLTLTGTGITITGDAGTDTVNFALSSTPLLPANNLSDVASKALSRSNLNIDAITRVSDADYTISLTDKHIVQIGTMSAIRTWTLPLLSTFAADGKELIIGDSSGTVSSTNYIVITTTAPDTFSDGTSVMNLKSPGSMRSLVVDKTSGKWVYDRGSLRVTNDLSDLNSASTARTNLGAEASANKGAANGYAPLNSSSLVPVANYSLGILHFGDGGDGSLNISSGTTVLSKDTYYSDLTLSGTAILTPQAFRIFVSGTLDLTNAQAGAIRYVPNVGTAGGAAGAAGAGGAIQVGSSIGGNNSGGAGAAGTTTAGATPGTIGGTTANGGTGGRSGSSAGSGSGGAGGSGGFPTAVTNSPVRRFEYNLIRGASLITGGGGGRGGASGGGNSVVSGGGGGGGGAGGLVCGIWARTVARGASTAVGAISFKGANGGNGGTPAGTDCGGGAGGGAGGGGWIYFVYAFATGVSATLFDVTGGNGGNGGNGTGTGTGAVGGGSGEGGRVTLINASSGALTEYSGVTSLAGAVAVGTTGGAGATATAAQYAL